MTVDERVQFEIELQDLARKHKLELVEPPVLTYGPGGIHESKAGTALVSVYDKNGAVTVDFCVQFHPTSIPFVTCP